MTPPPITVIFFGTSLSSRAPVKLMIRSVERNAGEGNSVGCGDYVLRLKLGLATFEESDLDLVCGDKGTSTFNVFDLVLLEQTLDAVC